MTGYRKVSMAGILRVAGTRSGHSMAPKTLVNSGQLPAGDHRQRGYPQVLLRVGDTAKWVAGPWRVLRRLNGATPPVGRPGTSVGCDQRVSGGLPNAIRRKAVNALFPARTSRGRRRMKQSFAWD